ncbi:unnamed protein product [Phytophthora fragariaefolia]|uniref:Unnamed protein product n=1 Tax=Phytophthora fragariaefolia TaxID=1490495 RepID=A0A9W6Y6F0_9STRA|nr:unnamed protein product [Phytophthora fragariaefolia]
MDVDSIVDIEADVAADADRDVDFAAEADWGALAGSSSHRRQRNSQKTQCEMDVDMTAESDDDTDEYAFMVVSLVFIVLGAAFGTMDWRSLGADLSGQKLVSFPLHTHNTYARRTSPTSHKIGDPSDSEISEIPGSTRNSRVGVLEAAIPVAPVALAPRVKLDGSVTAAVSSTTAPSLPSISRSPATPAPTLADLERVLGLRDNRLEFAQAERDVKLGKLVSYDVAKPFPEPSHELFRRLQGSSSIDEHIAALEKEIVGGPHPAVVAGEQQADAFAARARADLLEHELRETMKRVFQLEESEKTASALVRSLKEQVAQLENRNISLQELHQSTNLERDSWSTERIRLDATIRDNERIIASKTADYHCGVVPHGNVVAVY